MLQVLGCVTLSPLDGHPPSGFPQFPGGTHRADGGAFLPGNPVNRLQRRGPFLQPEGRTLDAARSWEGKPSLGFRVNTCLVLGGALAGAHGLAAAAGGSFRSWRGCRSWGSSELCDMWGQGSLSHLRPHDLQDTDGTQA